MKKFLLVIFILVIFQGCGNNSISINSINETNKSIIAEEIFEKYLSKFISEDTKDKNRINKFEIVSCEVLRENNNLFETYILFNVTPYSWENYDFEGNGKFNEDSKTISRFAYVTIKKIDNKYIIQDIDFKKTLGK